MKRELSIEEKARRYDEAIDKFDVILNLDIVKESGTIFADDVRKILPELVESEDEIVRKWIIDYLNNRILNSSILDEKESCKKALAWLEKQGNFDEIVEKAKSEKQRVLLTETNGNAGIDWDTRSLADTKMLLEYGLNFINKKLEKQGEKKHADKVEPKFKVGDMVKHKNNPHLTYILKRFTDDGNYEFHAINGCCTCFSVVKYQDEWELVEQKHTDNIEPKFKVGDWVVNNHGEPQLSQVTSYSWPNSKIKRATNNLEIFINKATLDKQYHLWTIQDAKDGDVLASKDGNDILIFRRLGTTTSFSSYYNLKGRGELGWTSENFIPATKEQRDLLFQKMKEAGYEWDAEKKEPKIIDWSKHIKYKPNSPSINKENSSLCEEDENIKQSIINILTGQGYQTQVNWFKSIKDRVQPQPKQEWSKEDEERIKNILSVLDAQVCWDGATGKKENPYQKEINWLKFLRPQNNITDEELAQAKKDAYNDALDKIEYHSGEPTFDDGWSAAIWYLKKRNAQPQITWIPSDEQMNALDSTLQYSQISHNSFEYLNSLFNDLKKLKG